MGDLAYTGTYRVCRIQNLYVHIDQSQGKRYAYCRKLIFVVQTWKNPSNIMLCAENHIYGIVKDSLIFQLVSTSTQSFSLHHSI